MLMRICPLLPPPPPSPRRSQYRSDIKKFFKYALQHQDVWAVTISQFLDWMEAPVPASEVGRARRRCSAAGSSRWVAVRERSRLLDLLRTQHAVLSRLCCRFELNGCVCGCPQPTGCR